MFLRWKYLHGPFECSQDAAPQQSVNKWVLEEFPGDDPLGKILILKPEAHQDPLLQHNTVHTEKKYV